MTKQSEQPQILDDTALEDIRGGAEIVRNAGLRSDGELVQAVMTKPRLKVTGTPEGLTDG